MEVIETHYYTTWNAKIKRPDQTYLAGITTEWLYILNTFPTKLFIEKIGFEWDFSSGAVVKNLPANAGDTRDECLIPGSRRYPAVEMSNLSSILAWKIPQTEDPGGLQFMRSQRVGHDWVTKH